MVGGKPANTEVAKVFGLSERERERKGRKEGRKEERKKEGEGKGEEGGREGEGLSECVCVFVCLCIFSIVRCIKMYLNLLGMEEYFCHSAAALALEKI